MSRRTTILMAILTAILCSSVTAAGKKPLKVYILAGQSNMEGQAKIETFDYIGDDPKTAPLLKEMRGPDGKPRVCGRAWISYLTGSPVRGTLGEDRHACQDIVLHCALLSGLLVIVDRDIIDQIMRPSLTMVIVPKVYSMRACRDREYG